MHSIGMLARRFNVPTYVIRWAVESRGIAPAGGRVSRYRLWSDEQLPQIAEAIQQTAEAKGATRNANKP